MCPDAPRFETRRLWGSRSEGEFGGAKVTGGAETPAPIYLAQHVVFFSGLDLGGARMPGGRGGGGEWDGEEVGLGEQVVDDVVHKVHLKLIAWRTNRI